MGLLWFQAYWNACPTPYCSSDIKIDINNYANILSSQKSGITNSNKWYHLIVLVLNEVIRFKWSDMTYSLSRIRFECVVCWSILYLIRRWCNIVRWCDRAMMSVKISWIWTIYRVILISFSHHRADRLFLHTRHFQENCVGSWLKTKQAIKLTIFSIIHTEQWSIFPWTPLPLDPPKQIFTIYWMKTILILPIWGVIIKFLDWCDEINTYQAMLSNFVGNIKQQMFY